MTLLDENPNTPERTRRFNQILARLINRGVQAGAGLGSDEGVMRVNAGRSLFIPDAVTGVACLLETPVCVLDFLEVDLYTDGGLEHASDTGVNPARDRLRVKVKSGGGVVRDSDGLSIALDRFSVYDGSASIDFTTAVVLNLDTEQINTNTDEFTLASDALTIASDGNATFGITVTAGSAGNQAYRFDFVLRKNGVAVESTRTQGGAGVL